MLQHRPLSKTYRNTARRGDLLAEGTDLAEQVLVAIERRYRRQRLILIIAVVVLLFFTTYFAWHFFQEPVKVVPLSRPVAETSAGITKATENRTVY